MVDANFYKGLVSGPESRRWDQTMFDEIRLSAEYSSRPTEHVAQALSHFHGPFGGASPTLSNISRAIQGRNKNLRDLAGSVERAVDITLAAISDVHNTLELINDVVGMNMTTPLLREFVAHSSQCHPSVTEYIQQHNGQYPYFQQVSEEVGTMFTIISNAKEIDPMFSLECGQLPNCSLETASRMLRQIYDKIFEPIAGTIEDSNSFLNTLFLRALPCTSMSHLHPNYSRRAPIAHGHNYCMDPHHRSRAIQAIPEIFERLVHTFGDRLRILNQIFPVDYRVKYEDEIYQVNVEGKPTPVDAINQNATPPPPKKPEKPMTTTPDAATSGTDAPTGEVSINDSPNITVGSRFGPVVNPNPGAAATLTPNSNIPAAAPPP